MKKRTLLMCLALVLSLALAAGGTLAYLTDRDSAANVFTIGNVDIELDEGDFEDGQPLLPGQDIEKQPNITNIGSNPAWVWATIAIPAALDDVDNASNNVIHFNFTKESIADGLWNWTDENDNYRVQENVEIDGVKYNLYTVLYDTMLQPGETTLEPVITKVYMDDHIDITPEGDLYHVQNGVAEKKDWNLETDGNPIIYVSAYAIQTDGFDNAEAAYEAYTAQWGDNGTYYDPDTSLPSTTTEHWDGTVDTSWYNDTDTEFVLTTAEQLAGLAKLVDEGNNFAGKTVKLGTNMCLGCGEEDGCDAERCFDPIGSYRKDVPFCGVFDGQKNSIKNLHQNTWDLDNGYYYGDLGLGLFGKVDDAEIKNLTMDGANLSGESAICGAVASCAYGDTTFENITVKNSKIADYQYYAGGVVGWASGDHKYINVKVDASTIVGSQWGDFNNANGGIIGGSGSNGTYHFEDCTVACRIDAVNDVVSAYQWYSYRRSGMLIGDTGHKTSNGNGTDTAAAPNVTCDNVTVIYGDWANYTYCEFAGTGYPYVRVQAGVSVDAYSNVRYGHPTDANGKTVVDDDHVHNEGEDHQLLIVFDQLFGGPTGDRYCTYGMPTHDGVTVVYNNK